MLYAIDTEGFLITGDEPAPRLVSAAIASSQGHWLYPAHMTGLPDLLAQVIARHSTTWANAPFDACVLTRAFPQLDRVFDQAYAEGRITDILTCEKLIDIEKGIFSAARSYGLGAISELYGLPMDKNDPWRMRYSELIGLEISQWPEAAKAYAINDAVATLRIREEQAKLDTTGVLDGAPARARIHRALYQQHPMTGITTDPCQVEWLDRELENEANARWHKLLECGLAAWGGTKAAPKLVKKKKLASEMLQVWADSNRVELELSEKTSKPSLSADALAKLDLPDGHPVTIFRELGSWQTLRSKNIPPLQATVVRSSYQELIATGRTSMRRPNLQNQPREYPDRPGVPAFRECLVARPGHVFVISDYSAAELVTLGQVQLDWLGSSALAQAMIDGRDPHAELGASIGSIPFDQFDYKANKKHAALRTLAKAANFGFPGGLGLARFCDFALASYGIVLTEAEARSLKASWRSQWVEMPAYFKYIEALKTLDGTYSVPLARSGRIRGGCTFTQACNTPFQGLAADAAGDALWALYCAGKDEGSPLYGCHQVLFVHDENVTEAPVGQAEAAMVEQERIMIESFARWCPDVPVKVESKIVSRYKK